MKTAFQRTTEEKELEALYHSKHSEFLAIYGRRRIGKTFLINQYFQNKGLFFEVTGIHKATLTEQLNNFTTVLADVFNRGQPIQRPKSWYDAFTLLRKQIEAIPKETRVILFFDELPWFATPRSNFLQAIEHCWNRYLSRMNNVILIVCGSAASWMIDNIINNKGGLHGRLSKEIRLLPFTLAETECFLKSNHIDLPRKDILEINMVMGGVAKYLTQIKSGMSAAQIINDVCFTRNGYLFNEFEKLYRSLFDNYELHVEIIKQLAKKKKGLTRNALLDSIGLSSGGTLTKVLRELEASGFIMKVPVFGTKMPDAFYRLADEYSLFYLDWIAKAPDTSLQGIEPDYWLKQHAQQRWPTWAGYAFEDLCLKHVDKIKSALGIGGVTTASSTWQDKEGQIDLVIDRNDNCINLCEIKFCQSEFIVDKTVAEKLNYRKQLFRNKTKTKKALMTTLITPYGAIENDRYRESVQNQLTADIFF